MGLAIAQLNLQMLTSRKDDLDNKIMQLTQQEQSLSALGLQLTMALTTNPTTANTGLYTQVEDADKQISVQLAALQTQEKAVTQEIDSVNKLLDDNVKRDFKEFGAN